MWRAHTPKRTHVLTDMWIHLQELSEWTCNVGYQCMFVCPSGEKKQKNFWMWSVSCCHRCVCFKQINRRRTIGWGRLWPDGLLNWSWAEKSVKHWNRRGRNYRTTCTGNKHMPHVWHPFTRKCVCVYLLLISFINSDLVSCNVCVCVSCVIDRGPV